MRYINSHLRYNTIPCENTAHTFSQKCTEIRWPWLAVRRRGEFMLATLMFKTPHGLAPKTQSVVSEWWMSAIRACDASRGLVDAFRRVVASIRPRQHVTDRFSVYVHGCGKRCLTAFLLVIYRLYICSMRLLKARFVLLGCMRGTSVMTNQLPQKEVSCSSQVEWKGSVVYI